MGDELKCFKQSGHHIIEEDFLMNLFRKIGVAEGMENSRRQEVWKSRGDGQRRDESQRGVHFEGGDVAVIFEDSGD